MDLDNLAFLPPDHPLMVKLQDKLNAQLLKNQQQVTTDLTALKQELKLIEKEKESTSLKLYDIQTISSESKLTMQRLNQQYEILQTQNSGLKQRNAAITQKKDEKNVENEQLKKKFLSAQADISKLNNILQQIVQYNQNLKNEIQLNKKITYKEEDKIMLIERENKKQDLLIMSLEGETKKLQDQKNIYELQIVNQKSETQQSYQIIKETQLEQEKILAEKKSLIEKWQNSLKTLQRMDVALLSVKEALNNQKDTIINIQAETNNLNNEIIKENLVSEQVQYRSQNLKKQLKEIETAKIELQDQENRFKIQIDFLNKSLKKTENTLKLAISQRQNLEEELEVLQKNILKLKMETENLWKDVQQTKFEQNQIEKTAQNLNKQTNKLLMSMDQDFEEYERIQNETIKVTIEIMNTQSQIQVLQQKKEEVEKEKERNEMNIMIYEKKILVDKDTVNKKLNQVQSLNSALADNKIEVKSDDNSIKASNLIKQTKELREDSEKLNQEWGKKSQILIQKNRELEKKDEQLSICKTKETDLQQKMIRIKGLIAEQEQHIRTLRIQGMDHKNDIMRLNNSNAQGKETQLKLEKEYADKHLLYTERLKQLEKDQVHLQNEIENLMDGKKEVLQAIEDIEREIYLWERKINLEEELQQILDPNYGKHDIQIIKKENSKKEDLVEQLSKRQELMIQEIEKAINKRKSAQVKEMAQEKIKIENQLKQKKKDEKIDSKTLQLQNQIKEQEKNLLKFTQGIHKLELDIQAQTKELQLIQEQTSKAQQKLAHQQEISHQLILRMTQLKIRKSLNIYTIQDMQQQTKKYTEILQKIPASKVQPQVRKKLEEQRNINQDIVDAITQAIWNYPQYQNILNPLIQLSK